MTTPGAERQISVAFAEMSSALVTFSETLFERQTWRYSFLRTSSRAGQDSRDAAECMLMEITARDQD